MSDTEAKNTPASDRKLHNSAKRAISHLVKIYLVCSPQLWA
ncbi:MAG: hypothetical protein ABJM43_01490 [Paracoccaceae bacterium]